ncbi:tRNA (carboxymethyluridine(34)-5-O)-methyltransferase [Malassezia brasiliensis]|uniref:tRNA (Carboxymethyluridine(34)-5-O)-methyltransferase n=1 Tax=Malassezia brasiliensis TaxID=1821822 RepID=A0AAF0DV99_9BASI|nr:tRNA (carboxymethyluridine(34)-5-O)-methyltransferase [Malassezia brasiliensis]
MATTDPAPPRSAYALVTQLRAAVAALRHDTRGADALHVLDAHTAAHLGLYPADAARPPRLAPETWSDACDALQSATAAARQHLAAHAPTHLAELGAQATEYVRAAHGIEAAARLADTPGTAPALPAPLYMGALRADAPPTPAPDAAHAIADALCAAIEPVAAQLRLESFVERVDAPSAAAPDTLPDAVQRTHTFTSGGRIIVLDIELGVDTATHTPHVRLHISYARAEDTPSPSASDTRLATLLGSLLQQLALVLHGAAHVDDAALRACAPLPVPTTPYASALCLWRAFVAHLATLAYLDELSAHAVRRVERSPAVDLFAVLEATGSRAEQLCRQQADALGVPPHTPLATLATSHPDAAHRLTRSAQGLALQHTVAPYLVLVYALPAPHAPSGTPWQATLRLAPCAVPLADAAAPDAPDAPDALPAHAHASLHADGTLVTHVARWTPLRSEHAALRPVAYVALLAPSVAVPHRVAHAVWAACGLAPPPWSDTRPTPPPHHTDYAAALLPHHSWDAAPGDASTQLRTISALPHSSLAQLYAALALLRDHARIGELLRHAAPTRTRVTLAVAAHGASSAVRLSLAVASRAALVRVTIAPTPHTASGWAIDAEAVRPGAAERHTLAPADTAAWADTLADRAQLRDVVDAAYAWSESALTPRS